MKRLLLSLLVVSLALAVAAGFALAAGAWLVLTEPGLQTLAARWLPDNVRVGKLHGRAIGPIRLDELHVDLPGASIRAARVEFDWTISALFEGQIRLRGLQVQTLEIALQETPGAAGDPSLVMPVVVEVPDGNIRGFILRAGDDQWQADALSFAVVVADQGIAVSHLEVAGESFQATGSGKLPLTTKGPVDFGLQWRLRSGDWPEWSGRTRVSGTLEELAVAQEAHAPFPWQATGRVRLLDEPPAWDLVVEVPEMDPSTVRSEWPATRVGGRVDVRGIGLGFTASGALQIPEWVEERLLFQGGFAVEEDRIAIEGLDVAFEGTPAQAAIAGAVVLRPDLTFELSGDWRELQWPLTGVARFESPRGTFEVSGDAAAYTGRLSAGMVASVGLDAPLAADVESGFSGSASQMEFHPLRIRHGDGLLEGQARLDWQGQPTLHAQLHADGIDPALFTSAVSGRLAFDLTVDGSWPPPAPRYAVSVEALTGVLHGRPVSGRGRFQSIPAGGTASQVSLRIGDNTLEVKGALGRQLDLTWALDAPELAAIVPAVAGRLNSRGRLSGSVGKPRVDISAHGGQLRWKDVRIGELRAHMDFDVATGALGGTRVDLQDVHWREIELAAVTATADGTVGDHTVVAQLTAADGSVQVRARGGYGEQQWSGRVTQLESQSQLLGPWRLEAPVTFTAGAGGLAVKTGCFVDPPGAKSISKLRT